MTNIPEAEVDVDTELAKRLLTDQHADLADLPVIEVANGWDNVIFRIGDDLALRVPRRKMAAQLVAHEQEWLPRLAPDLPLTIPAPLRVGVPTEFFPWHWSILPWLPGEAVGTTPFADPSAAAASLGEFLAALHQPTEGSGPINLHRGGPLAERDARTRKNIALVANDLPVRADRVVEAWSEAAAAPVWAGPAVLLHGDLHPLNMLATDGELSAVIDFGDITDGDPATDLMIGFYLFGEHDRSTFREAADSFERRIDDATWLRAKGWAVSHMTLIMAHSADKPVMLAMAKKGLERTISK